MRSSIDASTKSERRGRPHLDDPPARLPPRLLTLTALGFLFGAYPLDDGVFAVVPRVASHGENRR